MWLVYVCMIVAGDGLHAEIDKLVDGVPGRGIFAYAYIHMYVYLIYLCTLLKSLA